MAEYIEREALLKNIRSANTDAMFLRAYAINFVEAAPAADVEDVVRCKDCKWHSGNCVGGYYNCIINMHLVGADDYCSCGERKDNG